VGITVICWVRNDAVGAGDPAPVVSTRRRGRPHQQGQALKLATLMAAAAVKELVVTSTGKGERLRGYGTMSDGGK
jgi:hypothetical protein